MLKAGAFRSLSSLYKVEKLHPNSHLYTSDHFLPDFPGRKFRITSSCGFGKKEVKEMLAAEKRRTSPCATSPPPWPNCAND